MINQRIQELRQALNLTQKQLGLELHLSQNQISVIEKGTRRATDRVIDAICKRFNVSYLWLVEGIPPMFSDFTHDLDVDPDVKELTKLYSKLSKKDRKVVKDMIKAILKENAD